jgi:hypothetical protein
MIADVIKFLRKRLNKALPRDSSEGAAEDLFVYVGTNKDDSVSFKSDAVSILLVRIEEETALRQAVPYASISADGKHQKVAPEIRMNLWVLFVARFPDDYSLSLQHISDVISYFQNHRVFNQENSTDLKEGVSKLVLELVTPTFAEQNEIWGALRSAYQPSSLYKISMIIFRDEDAKVLPAVKEQTQTVTQIPQS